MLHFLIHCIKRGEIDRSGGEVKSQMGEMHPRVGELYWALGENQECRGESATAFPLLLLQLQQDVHPHIISLFKEKLLYVRNRKLIRSIVIYRFTRNERCEVICFIPTSVCKNNKVQIRCHLKTIKELFRFKQINHLWFIVIIKDATQWTGRFVL